MSKAIPNCPQDDDRPPMARGYTPEQAAANAVEESAALARAVRKLADVSERLHSVADNCSGDYHEAMHREAVEFDDARKVIENHVKQSGGNTEGEDHES